LQYLKKLWTLFLEYFVYAVIRRISTAIENRVYTNKIIFNTVWEDSRIDAEALKIKEDDVVLTISSAGCNGLALLLQDPKHVYLVDRNPCQNALVELKLAAIKNLDYHQFWMMFGEGVLPNFSTKYYQKLRPDLSPASQKFWDSKSFYFDGTGMKRSFYWRGTSGTISWCIGWYISLFAGLHEGFKALFNAKSLEEQRQIYKKVIAPKIWSRLTLNIIKSEIYLTWSGIPVPQQKLLVKMAGSTKSVGNWIKDQAEFVLTQLPVHDNYYWRLYFSGKYTKDCCPDYLKEENFEKLKATVGKITVITDTITDFLKNHKHSKISTYILLDHMDWMVDKPELLTEEWNEILSNATKDPKFLWRSASPDAEFVLDTTVTYKGKQTQLRDLLEMDVDTATRLHVLDRVHTYTSLHIANLKGFN